MYSIQKRLYDIGHPLKQESFIKKTILEGDVELNDVWEEYMTRIMREMNREKYL